MRCYNATSIDNTETVNNIGPVGPVLVYQQLHWENVRSLWFWIRWMLKNIATHEVTTCSARSSPPLWGLGLVQPHFWSMGSWFCWPSPPRFAPATRRGLRRSFATASVFCRTSWTSGRFFWDCRLTTAAERSRTMVAYGCYLYGPPFTRYQGLNCPFFQVATATRISMPFSICCDPI